MPELTEYGDVMLNDYVDEWGRRRINGLLEDGVKIFIAAPRIILKTWSTMLNVSYIFSRSYCSFRLTQTLSLAHTLVRHRCIRLTQALRTLREFYVAKPTAKKTKLLLVFGDLAIQLSND